VSLDNVNILGNNIVGISSVSVSSFGILVQHRSTGLVIKGNTISEGAFANNNYGIGLETTVVGTAFFGVNISDNVLAGDIASGGGSRINDAVWSLFSAQTVSINVIAACGIET